MYIFVYILYRVSDILDLTNFEENPVQGMNITCMYLYMLVFEKVLSVVATAVKCWLCHCNRKMHCNLLLLLQTSDVFWCVFFVVGDKNRQRFVLVNYVRALEISRLPTVNQSTREWWWQTYPLSAKLYMEICVCVYALFNTFFLHPLRSASFEIKLPFLSSVSLSSTRRCPLHHPFWESTDVLWNWKFF